MRRALRGAIGTLLASGVLGLTRPVAAQTPTHPLPSAPPAPPARKVLHEETVVLTNGHYRLETMKVQLALLADPGTFPYYIGARFVRGNLELCGYVPNNMVRQRALDLARHNTFFNVFDRMTIHAHQGMLPSPRAVEKVQKESAELLIKNFGEAGRKMKVEARPNGVVALTGSIDAVENKLAVSNLFRQQPGCCGVLNQLTVEPVVRNGQKVVQVTKNGAFTVPPEALKIIEAEHVVASQIIGPRPTPIFSMTKNGDPRLPTIVPPKSRSVASTSSDKKTKSAQAVKPPAPVTKWGQSAMNWESQSKDKIATADAAKVPIAKSAPSSRDTEAAKSAKKSQPDSFASTHSPASSGRSSTSASSAALSVPPPPIQWKRPDLSEKSEPRAIASTKPAPPPTSTPVESAAKDDDLSLPALVPPKSRSVASTSSDQKTKSAQAVDPPAPILKREPSAMNWESQSKQKIATADTDATKVPIAKPATLPRGTEAAAKPAKKSQPDSFASTHSPTSSGHGSTSASSATLTAPPPPIQRKRPDFSEESEPRAVASAKPAPLPTPKPVAPSATASGAMPPVIPLDRPSRWPPAYDVRSAADNGRPGVIIFEDDEPTSPSAAPKAPAKQSRPPMADNLKRQVKAVCGRQARDVLVETQKDGRVLVTVKVASPSVGEKLTRKVLTVPEMASPNVQLKMDVAP